MRPADALGFVAERCLAPTPGGLVGIELEWFPIDQQNPERRVPLEVLRGAVETVGPLPGGAAITFEPGGQIELSSPPQLGVAAACAALQADLTALRASLGIHGICLLGTGLHPSWQPQRLLCAPRYEAMEAYFDRAEPRDEPAWGSSGRTMMTLSAAVQVNLDLGPEPERSWRLAHDLGPLFVGAFANSPFARGRPTGFRSTRFANWCHLDPARTRPIGSHGGGVVAATQYALAAPLLGAFVDGPGSQFLPVPGRRTFVEWMNAGRGERRPDLEDFAYHLTTLFPPVRPRGWLELRMIDAVPGSEWEVPAAVAAALLANPEAADVRLSDAAGLWWAAARHGLSHPIVAATARRAFAGAAEILDSSPADCVLADAVRAYAERFVERGRCPADDALDAWRCTGAYSDPTQPACV